MNAIKALMKSNIIYVVWNSDNNNLLSAIGCKEGEDGKEVDITDRVKELIGEHFIADEVTITEFPEVPLNPDMIGTEEISVSTDENGEIIQRDIEIHSLVLY